MGRSLFTGSFNARYTEIRSRHGSFKQRNFATVCFDFSVNPQRHGERVFDMSDHRTVPGRNSRWLGMVGEDFTRVSEPWPFAGSFNTSLREIFIVCSIEKSEDTRIR